MRNKTESILFNDNVSKHVRDVGSVFFFVNWEVIKMNAKVSLHKNTSTKKWVADHMCKAR